jgi:hypothetical protein
VFENSILRRIFRPKREELAGSWRKLHDKELCNLHASPNIIRVTKVRLVRWARDVAHRGDMRNAHKVLVGKPVRKRPLGRPRHRWEK